MKKVLIVLLGAILSFGAVAQEVGVKWETGTLQEALNKAKKNKKGPKLVFIDCYTTWCGPCKQMSNVIFPQKEAGDYFNTHFVNIKIDMEKGEGVDISKKFSIRAYPTYLILDADGNEVGRAIGSTATVEDIIKKVEECQDPTTKVDYLFKKFIDGGKKREDGVAYVKRLKKLSMTREIGEFFCNYYDEMKGGWYTSETWSYTKECLTIKNMFLIDKAFVSKRSIDNTNGHGTVNETVFNALISEFRRYLIGKIHPTPEEVAKAYTIAVALFDGHHRSADYNLALIHAAKAYSEGNIEKVIEVFDNVLLWNCSYGSFNLLQSVFTNIKEVPDEAKEAFVKKAQEKLESYVKQNKEEYIDKVSN